MKSGDLVHFYSSYPVFMKDYRSKNPGLVLSTKSSIDSPKGSASVLWSDGSLTNEHITYLRIVQWGAGKGSEKTKAKNSI